MEKEITSINHRFTNQELTIDPGLPRTFCSPEQNTCLITLGTSTPSPNPYRFGPAGVVVVNDEPYFIDAGDGVIRGIAKAVQAHEGRFAKALAPMKITKLFLTHLHSDHVVGLPSLILFPWIFGRTEQV